MLSGGPIQWRSKFQSIIAQSSTKAEYVSLALAWNKLLWIKRLMLFVGYKQSCVDIYIDNKSDINIASNLSYV